MENKRRQAEEVFIRAAARAVETDPVLVDLDAVLDADPLFQQVCAKLDQRRAETTRGEVLLRLLLVKHLYQWSERETAEQVQDSLTLRWFCRVGQQTGPSISSVSRAADQVPVAVLEELASRVDQASERAKRSQGRLRPTYRQRWR
jgi:transposase, IS5 family